jgi:dephospho-CoA kinase
MKKVALTGNIASGKTTTLKFIKQLGFPTISSDEIYHKLLKKDKILRQQLVARFGTSIINSDGSINTIFLRKLLQINPKEINFIEKLSHPKILKEIKFFLQKNAKQKKELVVVDIPLLFEKNLQSMFDYVITVYCSKSTQKKRLKQRNLDYDDIRFLFSRQLPVETKLKRSDYTIYNDKITFKQLKTEIKNICNKILNS